MGAIPAQTAIASIKAMHADRLAFGIAAGYNGTPDGRKKFGRIHREIVDLSERHDKLSLVIPRGHAKSTLGSVIGTAHYLVRDPGDRILLASAEQGLAMQLLGEARDILSGDLEILPSVFAPLREIYPWATPIFPSGEVSGPIQSLNVVGRTGTPGREPSAFTTSPGSNLAGRHPRRAIIDDPTNERTSGTQVQVQKAISFVQQLVPIMFDRGSPITHIGTPWAFWDVCAYLAENNAWTQVRRGVWDGPGGTPLCPSFLNEQEIRAMLDNEEVTEEFFSMQYLCEPSVGEAALFTQSEIERNRWPHDVALPAGQDILLVDPVAVATGTSNDKNGLIIVRVAPNGSLPPDLQSPDANPDQNVFIPHWAEELAGNADVVVERIEELANRVQSIWIEEVVFSSVFKPWLRDRGRVQAARIRRQRIPGKSLDMRLSSFPTALRTGLLRFAPVGYPGQQLLESRLVQYPKAAHDDLPAALALLASHLERRGPLPLGNAGDPAPHQHVGNFAHIPGILERMGDTGVGSWLD